jgi:hypothetical protein
MKTDPSSYFTHIMTVNYRSSKRVMKNVNIEDHDACDGIHESNWIVHTNDDPQVPGEKLSQPQGTFWFSLTLPDSVVLWFLLIIPPPHTNIYHLKSDNSRFLLYPCQLIIHQ